MLDRAYSILHVKEFSPSGRRFSGIATSPKPDRLNDVIESDGIQFKNPLPLLLFHNSTMPVGTVRLGKPTAEGTTFTAEIPEVSEPGDVKNLTDRAAHFVKYGLVRAVSVGFRPLKDAIEHLKDGGLRFLKTEVLELSLVPIPAHQDALIHTIKSFDSDDWRSAHAGIWSQTSPTTPGTTGTRGRAPARTAMNLSEQLKSYTEQRDAKQTEMDTLMDSAAAKGETLDAEQSETYDKLKDDVEAIETHLKRLEARKVMLALKEAQGQTVAQAQASRVVGTSPVITVRDNLPPGIGFTRLAIAKTLARIDSVSAAEFAANRWPDDARVKSYFQKAAVPAGTTQYALWAGNLVDPTNLASEFVEYLRPMTLVGRLPLRRVPFNIRFTSQTTGAVAGWVGEGKGKPVTSFQTGANTLLWTKIAAIAVITQELARFSSPSAEAMVRDELARAVTERLDIDFIDPAHAAVANVNPASITNGLTALSSAGTSADNIRTDIQNLLEQFILNNMNAASVVLIMPNTLALAASILVNALGQPEFPGLTINGGTIAGVPVFTTQYAANQSGGGNLVIALDPNAILLADDGQVDVSASMEASVEMSDAPTITSGSGGTAPVAASLVSLWQTNSIGIKAERFVNWTKARSTAVVYMDDVNWGSIGSPS